MLEDWIGAAQRKGASDLHVEPRLPLTIRVRGRLQALGEAPATGEVTRQAQALLGTPGWPAFMKRGSADLSRTIAGVRCRINILRSARGVGLSCRLLPAGEPSLTELNLLPQLSDLVESEHGLVLVTGPTGCGKTSTLAALLNRINRHQARHILTIEQPIEYAFRSHRSLVRQRQVGRDTPSFEQALLDALREDPDVLMVGEMRERETMRLTLDAAETGHLVLATLHSTNTVDALQRIVSAFPAENRESVQAQLADVIRGVVCQRLRYRPELSIRVPECEVLIANSAVRHLIRRGDFFKLRAVIETGSADGMWTFRRYRGWLDERNDWFLPQRADESAAPSPSTGSREGGSFHTSASNGTTYGLADVPSEHDETEDDEFIVLQPPEESIADIISELDGPHSSST